MLAVLYYESALHLSNVLELNTTQATHSVVLYMESTVRVKPVTVFTRIVAAATINFSLIPVRLLIEGGSYYFPHPLNDSITPVLRSREYLFKRGYNERDSSEFSSLISLAEPWFRDRC